MANEDFIIENGKLKKYVGAGGDVVVPDGVTEIAMYAFRLCQALIKVELPSSLRMIRDGAFSGCSALEEVHFADSVVSISNGLAHSAGAFEDCISLRKINISPNAVVDKKTFINCPKALGAFRWFTDAKLKQRAVLNWLAGDRDDTDDVEALRAYTKRIRVDILKGMVCRPRAVKIFVALVEALDKKLTVDELDMALEVAKNDVELTAAILDYKNAHYAAAQLDKSEQTKTAKALGVTKLTLADIKKDWKLEDAGDHYAIAGYTGNATSVTLPVLDGKKPITAISEYGLSRNRPKRSREERLILRALTEIVVPPTYTEIGSHAFDESVNLERVEILGDFVKLYEGLFNACAKLQTIVLPSKPEFCGNVYLGYPFGVDSSGLYIADGKLISATNADKKAIKVPAKVKEVGAYAFAGCEKLIDVYFTDKTTIAKYAFGNRRGSIIIHAPAGSAAEAYAKANGVKFEAI